jgi:hypothetical protein
MKFRTKRDQIFVPEFPNVCMCVCVCMYMYIREALCEEALRVGSAAVLDGTRRRILIVAHRSLCVCVCARARIYVSNSTSIMVVCVGSILIVAFAGVFVYACVCVRR